MQKQRKSQTDEHADEVKQVQRAVGARLQALRKRHGLSQEELAHRIDKSVFAISSIERGVTFASLATLLDLSRVLEFHLSDLFVVDGQSDVAQSLDAITHMLRDQPLDLVTTAQKQITLLVDFAGTARGS